MTSEPSSEHLSEHAGEIVSPTDPASASDDGPPSRWPGVFGVISIIYAVGGLTCFGLQGLWLGVMDFIPEMWRGGVTMPLGVRLAFIAQILLVLVLGIMLLAGGIGLVRRKRSSVGLLKKWVILRLIMLVVGVLVTIVTAPAQIQIQRQVHEFQVKMSEDADLKPPPPRTDDEIWRGLLIQTGVISGVLAIYPFVLGMFLSRKRIADEIAEWR